MISWQKRFEQHFSRGPIDECWPWRSAISIHGYGRFMLDGKARIASRISYQLYKRPIPPGLHVLHTCDYPACVNPAHLFVGTHRQNMVDRNAKGRARGGSLKGELHPKAKLSNTQAREIRRLAKIGEMSQRNIAALFQISQPQVSMIKNDSPR